MWLWEMDSLLQAKALKARQTPRHLRFPLGWFLSIALPSIREADFWGRSLLSVAHDALMHYSKANSLSIWRENSRPWNMMKTARGQSLVDLKCSVRWLTIEFSTSLQVCILHQFSDPPTACFCFCLSLTCALLFEKAEIQNTPFSANHVFIWTCVMLCCIDIGTCNEKEA